MRLLEIATAKRGAQPWSGSVVAELAALEGAREVFDEIPSENLA